MKLSNNREDYIKLIYQLSEKNLKVTNKEIATFFDIKASSVSEMLRKLQKEGYVVIQKNDISLTDEGVMIAQAILNTHRIWETFLVNCLNFSLDNVHAQAELLEHVTSLELLEKLNEYLKYPRYSPFDQEIFLNKK